MAGVASPVAARNLVEQARQALDRGMLPTRVFNDPALYDLEKQRIFARTWVFLAHESEIPRPGDFVQRHVVDDSFVVVRDDAGQVRVLFNACRHRGMQVCRVELGHATRFRCAYHGWTYRTDGALAGIPHQQQVYADDDLRPAELGLISAPRVESHRGWIFVNLDPQAEPLADYLGDLKWYLELYTRKGDAGLEVLGAPQRWIVNANWKLGASNFIGDGYHTSTTHHSVVEAGVIPGPADFLLDGVQVTAGHGGLGFRRLPREVAMTRGFPPAIMDALHRNAPQQVQVVEQGLFPSHGTVFPNLSFLAAAAVLKSGERPVPYFTLRVWRPLAADRMEIWSWCLVEGDASAPDKEASRRSYLMSFGTSGTLEQDDTENWTSITQAAGGQMARDHLLTYRMGWSQLRPIADWPGPGTAYPLDYTEANERAFFRWWVDYLSDDA